VFGRRPADLIAAGALVALAAVIVWQSTLWPAAVAVSGNAVAMPRALAAAMLGSAVLLVLLRPPPRSAADDAAGRPLRAILGIAATIGLALLLQPLGLILAGIPYLLTLQAFGRAPGRLAFAVAIGMPVVIWIIFAMMLRVPLPAGLLSPWLGR
jgi:hypothetical protein